MTMRRQLLIACGMLLAAFLFSTFNSAAQNPSPALTTIYSFRGQYSTPPDGWIPAGVAIGMGGALYGTTLFGGAHGVWVVGQFGFVGRAILPAAGFQPAPAACKAAAATFGRPPGSN